MKKPISTYQMKPVLSFAIIALMAAACGPIGNQTEAQLLAKRDSIKNLRAEMAAELLEIETQLAALDSGTNNQLTTVTTLQLAPSKFEHFFTVQGVVETDRNAQVFPEAPGRILSINVHEGDRVSKGQVLMSIDSKVISNQIDEIKSRLSLAETVFKKQEKLWEQKVGSEIQFLEAKNNYESLKQNLETAQSQKALYTIVAPFDGIVDEVLPKEGEMASPAMPAFRLVNMSEVYIKADVTERYLGKIAAGDSVEVTFPSLNVVKLTTIDRLGNFINPNNRTFKMRLSMKNTDSALKPNLLGELKIRDYVKNNAIVIPASLVQMTPSGEEFVYVTDGKTAVKTNVKTGLGYNDRVEILEGLNGTEVLIDKGARSIKDGEEVLIQGEK